MNGPQIEDKQNWSLRDFRAWLEKDWPGYVMCLTWGGAIIFDPEGRMYCCIGEDEIHYREKL